MKKKVLFIITKSNWGGAQRYVFDLATQLPQDRFEVAVALGGTGAPDAMQGTLDSRLRTAGIRTIFVPSFMRDVSLAREWRSVRELAGIIRDERPDIVHLNSSKAGGLGALAARLGRWPTPEGMLRPKIIFTAHGLPWDEDRGALSRAAIRLASWMTFLLCDVVIAITRDNAARAALPLCRNKIRLVHNGLPPIDFLSREEARHKLGIAPDAMVVGSIAELTWNKGLQYLVRAAGALKRQGRDFFVFTAGEGEERTFLQELIEEEDLQGTMRLAGFVPDARQYLKAFDIFCLPSVKEGLPYVLLEAGQAGLPVVGSNIPGIAEIVGEHVSGLLFPPKNHHQLAGKLTALLDHPDLRQKLGDTLQKRVTSEFSIEHMVTQTVALY